MAYWHGYIGIENLGMNATQKQQLVEELRALGPSNDPQPCHLNHWRTRLDNDAVIFEALFNEDNLTIDKFKNWLADIYGIDPNTIDDDLIQRDFAGFGTPVVTFSRNGTDYLRFALFGGKGATWNRSRLECLGFINNNIEEWETNQEE